MAGLIETPQWEDEIYQLEQTDEVMGGPLPEGIANLQAQQLANRTAYLDENKADTDSPTFTGSVTVPTPSLEF